MKQLAFFLVALSLLACSNDDDAQPCSCSATCEEECSPTLLGNELITVDGVQRSYEVHLPSTHSFSQPMPVVFDLHGYTSTTTEQRRISGFNDLAEEEGFIVIRPMALADGENCLFAGISGRYWNADWGIQMDDIGFLNALLDMVEETYNPDMNRVYITGLSNGGFMAYAAACELSSRFAAVASVAGSMRMETISGCEPERVMPVLHIHGSGDKVIFWEGDSDCQGGIAGIEDVVDSWRSKAGCDITFTEVAIDNTDTGDGTTSKIRVYDNCEGKVQFLVVTGGGHNWPGSQEHIENANSFMTPVSNDFKATEEIWKFFKQFSLP